MRNKSASLLIWVALIFTLAVPLSVGAAQAPAAEDREGRFKLGADIGVMFATADEEAVGVNVYGDYFFNPNVSIGPLVQFGFTSDLFKFGPSVQLKYTHDIDNRWKAHLQVGLGFMYADLDGVSDDTGVLIPMGGGIEYRFTDNFSVGTTVLLNFMDLDKVRNENFSISLLGGIKFRF
jgi:hypothetical protein